VLEMADLGYFFEKKGLGPLGVNPIWCQYEFYVKFLYMIIIYYDYPKIKEIFNVGVIHYLFPKYAKNNNSCLFFGEAV
jgi:hypothetical protein